MKGEKDEMCVEFAMAHSGYKSKMIEVNMMRLTCGTDKCEPKLRLMG